jgi:uroporphyrinogen decarboxylase
MDSSRERVLKTLNFQTPGRLPRDLAGMLSTGISAFAYPKLVQALGLPYRPPRVYDTGQMLALPDLDVLDALQVDVVTICEGVTNAVEQPGFWQAYDFNGRLPAQVLRPENFEAQPDGSILQNGTRMTASSYVFDEEHGGQPMVSDSGDLPKTDLKAFKQRLENSLLHDEQIKVLASLCKQVRETSDRAVFFNDSHLNPEIAIHAHGGLAIFPIQCLTEPDYVHELHGIATEYAVENARRLLPEIAGNIDVILTAADDWGTQQNTIASPKVFRELFFPYRKRLNDQVHQLAPGTKTFLHSCGAIYTLIDLIIECGFDILNPVQWSAGKYSYQDWKDRARKRLVLWGGGVNSQATLPLGSLEEVKREANQVTAYMAQDGGYVFCNTHNILAEIAPEKVIALYQTCL